MPGAQEPSADAAATERETEAQAIDATMFFQQLVQRYRSLRLYEDEATLVEVTQREGEQPTRRESHLNCEITDSGELKIRTPKQAALRGLGLDIPFRTSEPMREAQRSFGLWLAPHLGLRFWDDPLRELRSSSPGEDTRDDGSTERLKPKRATSMKVGDRAVVQLELSSAEDVDADGEGDAEFDLYVDPNSMLVERVEGRERLPDGASYETTLEITSARARDEHGESIELPERPDEPPAATGEPEPWEQPETPAPAPQSSGGSAPQPDQPERESEPEQEPASPPSSSGPPSMRFPQ